jgi:Tfp pilus assembly protein PilN
MDAPELEAFEQSELEEAQPRSPFSSRLMLWLVVLSAGILFVPLYMVSTTLKQERANLEITLTQMQGTLGITPTAAPQLVVLKKTLFDALGQIPTLEPIQATLIAGHVDWPNVMARIANYDFTEISLSGLTQAGNQVSLTGRAKDQNAVIAYADMLKGSALFQAVTVQGINLKTLPTATPSNTTEPTAAPDHYAEFSLLIELKHTPE